MEKELSEQEKDLPFLGALLAPLGASIVQPVISSVAKGVSERKARRVGRGYMVKYF